MGWVLRLAETGPDAAAENIDLIEIHRSSGLADIANLGLTLSEAKELRFSPDMAAEKWPRWGSSAGSNATGQLAPFACVVTRSGVCG